ncbi:DivIVA domain-containing protein [soil metagenome]|jgi:cell division initiation protein|nr:DivIVA domain-containing protein [Deinococcota bacterium]
MKLSPLDVQHQEFDGALSGYSKKQVRDFLAKAADALEEVIREKKALREEIFRRDERIEALQAGELELKHAVVAAERIGNELKQNARREAELIIQAAEQQKNQVIQGTEAKLKQTRADLARLEREAQLFREQFRSMLKAYERSLESVPSLGRPVRVLEAETVED